MPRPVSERRVRGWPRSRAFKPAGIPLWELETVTLTLDELESVRLADLEGFYQEAAAARMGVSRQTFGRIVETARRKIADALVNGKALEIDGGIVQMAKTDMNEYRIAVPTRDGMVDPHFGSCRGFTLFDVKDGAVVKEEFFPAPEGAGCKSAAASTLAKAGVRVMLAGGMGEGAVRVMASFGITPVRGVSGPVRSAAEAWAAGKLSDSGEVCSHDHEGHDCSHHS